MKKVLENKLFKILWTLIKAIFGLIIALVLIIIITQRVFNNETSFFGYRIFTVASGSMEPKYKILDMLLVKEMSPQEIKVNDDLVYMGKEGTYADKVITHRVIKIEEKDGKRIFHTQGILDNSMLDPLVDESQIYGRVLYKLHILSFFSRFISKPLGFMLLIVLPIAVLILLEIIDIKEEREKLANEQEN